MPSFRLDLGFEPIQQIKRGFLGQKQREQSLSVQKHFGGEKCFKPLA